MEKKETLAHVEIPNKHGHSVPRSKLLGNRLIQYDRTKEVYATTHDFQKKYL